MNISTDWYTDIGGRSNNEDAVGVFRVDGGTLCVVADGLGGHEHGEIASNAALNVLGDRIHGDISDTKLRTALECANEAVVRLAGTEQMKTTIAALWMQSGKALAASVGDTRIYQFRQGKIHFQSVDHSLAQLDVISGTDTVEDVRKNPDRNKLIRVVGMKDGFKADISELRYQQGDAFLLCSDGFWEDVLEADMLRSLSGAHDAESWLAEMRAVLAPTINASSDNNSAIAVIVR